MPGTAGSLTAVSSHATMVITSLLLVGLASPAPSDAPSATARQDDGAPTRSLEELLDEARRARARPEAELQPVVTEIMDGLDASVARRPTSRTDAAKQELMQLGAVALPLLVPYLDPGESPENGPRLRAQITAEVLQERPSIGVTSALLEQAAAGTTAARRGALFALRSTPEPRRALPSIVAIVRDAGKHSAGDGEDGVQAAVLVACYRTIAAFGIPGSTVFLSEEIASGNADRQRLAIGALEYGPTDAVVGQVVDLLRSSAAAGLAEPITGFLRRRDVLLDEEDLAEAFVDLGLRPGLSPEDRPVSVCFPHTRFP